MAHGGLHVDHVTLGESVPATVVSGEGDVRRVRGTQEPCSWVIVMM